MWGDDFHRKNFTNMDQNNANIKEGTKYQPLNINIMLTQKKALNINRTSVMLLTASHTGASHNYFESSCQILERMVCHWCRHALLYDRAQEARNMHKMGL